MISRKKPLASNPSSKEFYSSWVVDKIWLIQESLGLKPDWFEETKLFKIKNLSISLNIRVFFRKLMSKKTDREFSKHCL